MTDKFTHRGIIAITLIAPFLIMRETYDLAYLPKAAAIQIGVLFLFAAWVIRNFDDLRFAKTPLNLPVLAFILWSLASIIWASNRYEVFTRWSQWFACALVFFLVVNNFDKKKCVQLLNAMVVVGFLTALVGIVQHIFKVDWIPQIVPPAAMFANKNMTSQVVVAALPLALLIPGNKYARKPYFIFLIILPMLVYLYFARARAAWIALVAEVAVFVFIYLIYKKKIRVAVLLAVTGVLLMLLVGPWMSKMHMAQHRLAIWKNTVEMIKEKPVLGYGLGNHKIFYPLFYRKAVIEKIYSEESQLENVHNDFLQAWSELGVIGLLILGWAGFLILRIAHKHREFPVSVVVVAITGLLANAFFSFSFQRSIPPYFLMIFIAVLSVWSIKGYVSVRIPPILITVPCVLLIAISTFHYQNAKADHLFWYLSSLEKMGAWRGVIDVGEEAYRHNPYKSQIQSFLGRAYIQVKNPQKGVAYLERAIKQTPYRMNSLLNLGVGYAAIGDYEKAITAYKKVLSIKPDYPKVYNNLGVVYLKQNDLDRAAKNFKIATTYATSLNYHGIHNIKRNATLIEAKIAKRDGHFKEWFADWKAEQERIRAKEEAAKKGEI